MNRMKTYLLLAALTSLLLVAGQAMGGRTGLMLALTFAVVMNVGSYWFSDTIVLRMHNAQEIGPNDSPEIFSMVQRLAEFHCRLFAAQPPDQGLTSPPSGR